MSVVAHSPLSGAKRHHDENDNPDPFDCHGSIKRVRVRGSPAAAGRCGGFASTSAGNATSALAVLRSLLPHMDDKVLAQALLECGNDVDAAIRRLSDLRLTAPRPAAAAGAAAAAAATEQQSEAAAAVQQQGDTADADRAAQATLSDARPAPQGAPAPEEALQTAGDWVDFLVQEMAVSRSVDDARARAAGVLQRFEAFVSKRVAADAAAGADSSGTGGVGASGSDGRQQPQLASCGGVDHPSSQRLVEALRENGILKRAVQIQAAKLAEKEKLEEQVAGLQHAVARYQEQLASLEMHNYSLSLHLQRAAGGSGMNLPGQRLPDIF